MKTEEWPTPYTTCDDPEVDVVRTNWRGNVLDIKRTRYSDFPCRDIVDDLVQSSQLEVFNQWDRNFRRKYYTRALFMAYEQGRESNERILDKVKLVIKNKLETFAYWILSKLW